MSKKDPKMFLLDILDAIDTIFSFSEGITFEEFLSDIKTNQATIRLLEVIGEAVKNVPTDVQKMKPEIPWQEFARMREKLIHLYFGVDLQIVWDTVNEDLPSLKENILQLLVEMEVSKQP